MKMRLPVFIYGFVFVGLVLTSYPSQMTPTQSAPEKAQIPADTIAQIPPDLVVKFQPIDIATASVVEAHASKGCVCPEN